MQWRRTEAGFLLHLVPGEEVIEVLGRFLARHTIRSGSVSGIGALTEVELGFYDRTTRKYARRVLQGDHELLSLTGNVSRAGGEPFAHLHAVVADQCFAALGGHFFRGVVSAVAEIAVGVWTTPVERVLDPDLGLRVLALDPDIPC